MNLVQRLTALGLVASSFLAACGDEAAPGGTDAPNGGGRAGAGGLAGRTGGSAGTSGAPSGKGGSAGSGPTVGGAAGSGGGADTTGAGAAAGLAGSAGMGGGAGAAAGTGAGIAGQGQGAGTGGGAGSGTGASGGPIGGNGSGGSGAGASAGSGTGGTGLGGSASGGANSGGANTGGTGAGASGGGFGGGSGGSGPIPKGLGACGPAKAITVGAVVTDTLGSGAVNIDLSCGTKPETPSALYEITSPKTGALDIQFTPSATLPNDIGALVTLEAGCASSGGQTLLCPAEVYEKTQLTVPIEAGIAITMALTRSPKSNPASHFEFSVGFRELVCGDGKIDLPEQCDPPNGTDCSATCRRQAPPCGDNIVTYPELCDPPGANGCGLACLYDTCPDLQILKDGGSSTGSFAGRGTVLRAACGASPKARQLTYEITAENTGVLELDIESDGNSQLSFVDSCTSKATELACETVKGTGRVTRAVTKGDKIVFVLSRDGNDPNPSVTVKAKTRAIVCGDSMVDPGEACDPPDGLTCAASCQRQAPPCGDSIVTAPEQCDPPNGTSCNAECVYIGCPNVVTVADGASTTVDLAGKPTFSESCGGDPNQVALAVVPQNTGKLDVTLEGDVGTYVSIAGETTCGEAGSNVGCRDAKMTGPAMTVSFPATKGQTLYLVIAGGKLAPGAAVLKVGVQSKP